jgi:hypothetical protein
MSLPSRLLGANPSIQVSTLLSGSLSTPSAKDSFFDNSYFSIASTRLTSSQYSVVFSNIPQIYTHLQIRISGRSTGPYSYSSAYLNYNENTTNLYTFSAFYGDGSTAAAGARGLASDNTTICQNIAGDNSIALTTGAVIADILDYTNTNKFKTTRSVGGYSNNGLGSPQGTANINASYFASTSAITSITCTTDGNFNAYTQISLYGIKGA